MRVHSDALYLSLTKARRRAGGYHYLDDPQYNGSIHSVCKTMINVMEVAADAEIGKIFINAQYAVHELNNSHRNGTLTTPFTNKTLKQKRYKSINMRFCWMQERWAHLQ